MDPENLLKSIDAWIALADLHGMRFRRVHHLPFQALQHKDRLSFRPGRTLCRGARCGDLWAAFNAHDYPIPTHLPIGKKWVRVADTSLQSPKDFSPSSDRVLEGLYEVKPYTSVLLKELV